MNRKFIVQFCLSGDCLKRVWVLSPLKTLIWILFFYFFLSVTILTKVREPLLMHLLWIGQHESGLHQYSGRQLLCLLLDVGFHNRFTNHPLKLSRQEDLRTVEGWRLFEQRCADPGSRYFTRHVADVFIVSWTTIRNRIINHISLNSLIHSQGNTGSALDISGLV